MNRKKIIISIIIVFIILACFKIPTLARYTYNTIWNYYLTSHGFYFSSESLGNSSDIVNTMWDGKSTYFTLKNSINNSKISEFDIKYTVKCEVLGDVNATCTLNGTKSSQISGTLSSNAGCTNNTSSLKDVSSFNKQQCEMEQYLWTNNESRADIFFDINPIGDEELSNVDVKITVNSTSPYRKKIEGVFKLLKNEKDEGRIIKTINNFEYFDELILSNSYNNTKCVTVQFNQNEKVVDIDDFIQVISSDSSGYVNKVKISIDGNSYKKIVFYDKTEILSNDPSDFIVEESSC